MCIATAVDFSIQVQMNQWKIVWLMVWIKFDILLEIVFSQSIQRWKLVCHLSMKYFSKFTQKHIFEDFAQYRQDFKETSA